MAPLLFLAAWVVSWGLDSLQTPPRDRPATPTGTAVISGRVVVRGTGPAVPVRRASVRLQTDALPEARHASTDADGRYRFDGLPAGSYRLTAAKPGFVTLSFGASRPFVHPRSLTLEAGESATADFSLPPGAGIDGRIVDARGDAAQNIRVSAVRLPYSQRGRRPVAVAEAITDDLGRFRLHSLPAGEYYVDAAPDRLEALGNAPAPGTRPVGFARTYHPGTPRIHEAATVRLTSGEDVAGIDIALTGVPLARVVAHVVDSSGRPPEAAGFRVQPVAGPLVNPVGYQDRQAPATFVFRAVPPGEYWLLAAAGPAPGTGREFAARRVTVEGQDVEVTLATAPGARVEGRVELDTADAAFRFETLAVVAQPVEFDLPTPGAPREPEPPVRVTADGRFTFASLFGPRILRLDRFPPGWTLKAVWLGEREIADTVTDFTASNAPLPVRVVLSNRTAKVSGTVAGEAGAMADARVIVFADDERLWGLWSRFVKIAAPSSDGHYAIEDLLPGSYRACAIEYLEDGAWMEPAILRRLVPLSVRLTAVGGATAEVGLTLREWP